MKTRHFLLRAATIGSLAAGLAACSIGAPSLDPSIQATAVSADAALAQARAQNGLSPLRSSSRLEAAAREQARYMASSGKMSHTAGASFARRMASNGVSGRAAENIAFGRFSAGKVVQVWMNSPPHRRNMMNPDYSHYGLASAKDPRSDRLYWAMVVGQ